MEVLGMTQVWLRPSRIDGKIELVVNNELEEDPFLGHDDLERLGVIEVDFPNVRSRKVYQVQATGRSCRKSAKSEKEISE